MLDVLPHRYPFLLIDRIVQIETGAEKRILAYKNVSHNEPFFEGHFPGDPVMPGVLQIESMAQAGGVLSCALHLFDNQKGQGVLAGIDKARFRRIVRPGDRLDLEVKLMAFKRNLGRFQGYARVEGELACEAIIWIAMRVL